MEAMRESWSDDRLDYLNRRVDDGFKQVDRQFPQVDEQFRQVGERFDRVETYLRDLNTRVDSLQRTMMQTGGGIVVALVGLIATQL